MEIIGELIDEMRTRHREGESLSRLVHELAELDLSVPAIGEYLAAAFCLSMDETSYGFLGAAVQFHADAELDRAFAPALEDSREDWIDAGPYPDLLCRRDRHAFRAAARSLDTVIIVCAADRDAPGPYCLHGVYRRSGRNAWNARDGEKIRAQLNLRLGRDLILAGPLDTWDERPACPRPPVLVFSPDGDVTVCFDSEDMAGEYRSRRIDWNSLYPAVTAEAL